VDIRAGLLPAETSRDIELGGRRVRVTEVLWSYWRLAAERQAIFFRRVSREAGPWTDDPILNRYRFTKAYRASDRVSQYLLHHVIYDEERDVLLRQRCKLTSSEAISLTMNVR